MQNKRKAIGNCKASYTLEAAVYIPIILFILLQTLEMGIAECRESKERSIYQGLKQLDVVSEFYAYQILDEAREEIENAQ